MIYRLFMAQFISMISDKQWINMFLWTVLYGLLSWSKSPSPTLNTIKAFTPSKLSPSLKIVSSLKGDYDDVSAVTGDKGK